MASSATDHVIAPRSARNTRGHIVQVALEQFTEHGYDGTSLQQIADRLGLTKAALYYHFKSKDDLLLAVLEPYFTGIETLMSDDDASGRPGRATPDEQIEAYLDFLLEHRAVLSYLTHDAAALARPAVASREQAFRARVTEGVAGANLATADHVKVSFALGGMQSAISAHAAISAKVLRGPILDTVYAVLRTLNTDGGSATR